MASAGRRAAVYALSFVTILLAGAACGDADPSGNPSPPAVTLDQPVTGSESPPSDSGTSASDERCEVLTPDDIKAALQVERVDRHSTAQGFCVWPLSDGGVFKLRVAPLAATSTFPSKKTSTDAFGSPDALAQAKPLTGVGDKALFANGTLGTNAWTAIVFLSGDAEVVVQHVTEADPAGQEQLAKAAKAALEKL